MDRVLATTAEYGRLLGLTVDEAYQFVNYLRRTKQTKRSLSKRGKGRAAIVWDLPVAFTIAMAPAALERYVAEHGRLELVGAK